MDICSDNVNKENGRRIAVQMNRKERKVKGRNWKSVL
jgi:hypothetical protein